MKELKELVWILTKHKVKEIEVITNKNDARNSANRYIEFYNLLVNETYDTENEYAEHLGYDDEHDNNYLRFKRNMKRRLHNTTFFIDINDVNFTDYQKAFIICNEKASVINNLGARNARNASINLILQYLPIAVKYNFVPMCYNWYKLLRGYVAITGEFKKFRYYSQQCEIYEEALIWENKSNLYYENIIIQHSNSVASKKELKGECEAYLDILLPKVGQVNSTRFELHTGLLDLFYSMMGFDWQTTIVKAEQWLTLLKSKESFSPLWEVFFLNQVIVSTIMLENHEEAEKLIQRAIEQTPDAILSWFNLQYLGAYNFILSGNYEKSWEVIMNAKSHDRFPSIISKVKEQMEIMQAYILVLSYLKGFELSHQQKGSFNMAVFMSNVPIFVKDKKGLNIAILLLQIFLLVAEEDFERCNERLKALSEYSHRHISNESELYRTHMMIKMMISLKTFDYNADVLEYKNRLNFTKLKNSPLRDAEQNHSIELIKYDDFWLMMLAALRSEYKEKLKPAFRVMKTRMKNLIKEAEAVKK